MYKQPYRVKNAKFGKVALIGILASFLFACGEEEAAENNVGVSNANAAQSNYVSDIVTAPAEDAGFLNYDIVVGNADAPVEIIEYASYTCAGCSNFHKNIYSKIKEELIDTGKAKFTIRSVISNQIDGNISKLVRCVSEQRAKALSDAYLDKQDEWLSRAEQQRLSGIYDQQTAGQKFMEFINTEVEKIAALAGLNKARIDACYNNVELADYLHKVQTEGDAKYRIEVTPTVIVNGNKVNATFSAIERAVESAIN